MDDWQCNILKLKCFTLLAENKYEAFDNVKIHKKCTFEICLKLLVYNLQRIQKKIKQRCFFPFFNEERIFVSLSGMMWALCENTEIYDQQNKVFDGIISSPDNICISEQSRKVYTCSICNYSAPRMDNYKRHMRRHTGQMFECDVCGVRYNCKYGLQKHKEAKHGSKK